ncbi:MAG TPA: 2'-5' RNA ligase family protein [Bryobacteraceae bacterium]|nr:2'-5' RNA ligase family protein [Bryobacteraceae bacterium]
MAGSTNGAEHINLFALVVYIPDPLARFLDDLRRELTPGCLPRAHVTILPPRPLIFGVDVATERARSVVSGFAPFDIRPGEVEIFQSTDVIYIGIKDGELELRELYRTLNTGSLACDEQYPFEPHITLAQDLKPGQVQEIVELARKRWAAYPYSRHIRTDRAFFVQSKADGTWVDLAEFRLQGVPVA